MKKRLLVALLAMSLSNTAMSQPVAESFTIKDIRIEGLQRITEGTVYNYLPVHSGDKLEEAQSAQILKALFETGFFQDIELYCDEDTLVIRVIERPTIGKITVTGNKELTTENLMTGLKGVGLVEGYVFDRSMLDMMQNELERLYYSHGKYGVKIEVNVEEKERNRVNVTIAIVENEPARIKEINIIGNERFSKGELLKSFTLAPSDYLSWVSRNDQYDKQKLSADLESLRTFYLDRGYLNFHIISTQVSITPDKQDIYITVSIEEGCQFKLESFKLAGELVLPEECLLELIDLHPGETFSRTKVANMVKMLQDKLGEAGYAFAKVNPVPELNEQDRTVSLTFFIEPGNKIYVRRVTFEGNSKTKDSVIRREVIQMEAAPVNTRRVEESRARLNRTGFFTDVKVEMKPVPTTTDEVDLVYSVEEASAGQIGGGVGYSDSDGLLFNANVSNRNFLGTGTSLDFNFNKSKAYTTYSIAYNDPYYRPDGVSRGFNLFYSSTDLGNATNVANYTTDAFGANINYGLPLSPHDRLSYGFGFQNIDLAVNEFTSPLEIINFINQNGTLSQEVNFAVGWIHNTFDRYIFPENGLMTSAGFTGTVPGSHLQYYRLSYNMQWYRTIGYGFILNAGSTLGYGNGYGKTNGLPFYKNFFAGGSKSIRGFKESTLGPKDSQGNPFGGNFMFVSTAGVIIPNFFSPETKSVRVSLFVDCGQVYDLNNKQSLADTAVSRNPQGVRFSTGISLTWMSPMAPLVFSLAKPLNVHEGDQTQAFSFTFGTV